MLAFGLVVAVAAIVVVREAGRIARRPPPALFDPDDAYDYVVEQLDDLVAATLTPADVRRILGFEVEYLRQRGIIGNGTHAAPPERVVFGGADTVAYILRRAADTGEPYLPEQVHAVVETQLSYLRAIGAIGPPDLTAGDERESPSG